MAVWRFFLDGCLGSEAVVQTTLSVLAAWTAATGQQRTFTMYRVTAPLVDHSGCPGVGGIGIS